MSQGVAAFEGVFFSQGVVSQGLLQGVSHGFSQGVSQGFLQGVSQGAGFTSDSLFSTEWAFLQHGLSLQLGAGVDGLGVDALLPIAS